MSSKSTANRPVHTRDDRVSLLVLDAVADAEGVSAAELPSPLYQIVDPEALDQLYEPSPEVSTQLTFTYMGHTVDVTPDGRVSVDGIAYEPDGRPQR